MAQMTPSPDLHPRRRPGGTAAPLALFICLSATFGSLCRDAGAQEVKAEEHTLQNGMRLLLLPRHDEPTVAGGWVAHVGSANERPGITGISHLFEHMMFKGTPAIGTKDAKKDQQIIAEQERIKGEMRKEEAALRARLRRGEIDDITQPESFSPKMKDLEAQFAKQVKAQRDILLKNEFDRLYSKNGASGMNAFTSEDLTAYFVAIPKNKLELWFWMESDRLLHPVFREFYSERDVVFEERRLRTESTPTGKFEEAFSALFWDAHPYGWPVVGWPSDIPQITKAQADDYFSLFYAPNNLTAVLVGDFDPKEALAFARRYLGRIPRGKVPPPEMTVLEPKKDGERRFYAEAPTNPRVEIMWHTVGFQHKDSYALDVLEQLLNGRTGRLYKALIVPGIATQAGANQESRKYAGLFEASGECKDGKHPEEVEKALYAEIGRLAEKPVPEAELQKVKNNFAASSFRRLSSNMPILIQLMVNDGLGDWREINQGEKHIQAVTPADIQRVAKKYLVRDNRAVAIYTRKGA